MRLAQNEAIEFQHTQIKFRQQILDDTPIFSIQDSIVGFNMKFSKNSSAPSNACIQQSTLKAVEKH
jgi:hypothetical protein